MRQHFVKHYKLTIVIYIIQSIFLNFIISYNSIAADPQKMAAIKNRFMPAITTEIRAFVNAAGYLRYLIANYAEKSSAFIALINSQKNELVKLSPKAYAVWEQIREIIIILPIIQLFDWRLLVIIESDASGKFIGAALLQPYIIANERALHPIAYYNKKLDDIQA